MVWGPRQKKTCERRQAVYETSSMPMYLPMLLCSGLFGLSK